MNTTKLEELTKYFDMLDEEEGTLRAYNEIPYALLRDESPDNRQLVIEELNQIIKYYRIYKKGKTFFVEGTNGDYVPAQLKYRMAYSLVNKEARFLFGEQPDITIEPKGDTSVLTEESKTQLSIMNDLIVTVLKKNRFQDILVKAARDCFIGKRVACIVNFNEEDGVVITFLNSLIPDFTLFE